MILQIYSYRDNRSNFFKPIFTDRGSVEDLVQSTERMLKTIEDPKVIANLKDCELFHLGSIDDVSAKIVLLDAPVKLLTCVDFLGENNG